MNLPAPVTAALGDETVAARVPLKGEDALFVTRTRTLVYHGEGLLSDESVEEFPHDSERVEVATGRRKAKIRLDYGLDGVREFAVPSASLEEALHPVLAGVLNAGGVTEPGETVTRTFRFSELTLVVTSHRVVKHVGAAVWDDEYEEIRYEDVTGLAVEEGNVASQLVIDTAGRSQRIKVPNRQARDVRERVEEALLAYHDVATLDEFAELMADDEEEAASEPAGSPAATSFESDLDPIDLSDPDEDDESAAGGSAEEQASVPPAGGSSADGALAEAPPVGASETDEASTADGAVTAGEVTTDDDVTTAGEVAPTDDATPTDDVSATGGGPTAVEGPSTAKSPAAATDAAASSADRAGGGVDGADGADSASPADQGTEGRESTSGPDSATGGDSAPDRDSETDGDSATGPVSEVADGFAEFETAVAEPTAVADELEALRRTVERQRDLLARQAELIEQIAAELDDER